MINQFEAENKFNKEFYKKSFGFLLTSPIYVCSCPNNGELFLILKERRCRRTSTMDTTHSNLNKIT